MSLADKPQESNYLNANGFELVIRRMPFITFFCQEATLPGMSLPPVTTGNPFQKLNFSSTNVEVGTFSVRFKVDENMKNYVEMLNWIKGLGFPESHEQYIDNKLAHPRDGVRSDASLFILTSSKIPNIEVKLIDLVPVGLGPLTMASNQQNVQYVEAQADFSIRDFTIENINECDPV